MKNFSAFNRCLLLAALALLITGASLSAQSSNVVEKARYFLSVEQMPDASRFLPDPPVNGSDAFCLDSLVYEQGKVLRGTPRGELAVRDAKTKIDVVMKRFGAVMERDFTPENYPVTADFLFRTITTARLTVTTAKDKFHRMRPYQYFNEPTPVPEKEAKDDFTSYPSGHTIRFWMAALTLAALDPAHQDDILKVGYELGQSRTIVGFHFQSDIDAARLAASAAYARLSADRAWQKAFRRAQREMARKH